MSRIGELEAAAKAKAVERVANLLQRPDQLEKVHLLVSHKLFTKVSIVKKTV